METTARVSRNNGGAAATLRREGTVIKIGAQADHGFDEPLGLLSDCHRRIEWFLGLMLKVARDERGRRLSPAGRRALEKALDYFSTAAPRHTADEEVSLFPLLRASGGEAALRVMSVVDRLEDDHRVASAAHEAVERLARQWIEAGELADGEARELADTLDSLQRIYEGHIIVEDREVFPAASRILSAPQLEEVGRQMAERRGVRYRGPIFRFLEADHDRLDTLLGRATSDPAGSGAESYEAFRGGILRHIGMEEKRLIPAATAARGGAPLPIAARLRADHGAIAALLVPTPTPSIVAELKSLLDRHNPREEEPGGLYDQCDRLLGAETGVRLVEELRSYPAVRLKPYNDGPAVDAHIRETMEFSRKAWEGYEPD